MVRRLARRWLPAGTAVRDAVLLAPDSDSPIATARAVASRLAALRSVYAWAELGISDFVAHDDLAYVFGSFQMRGNGNGIATLRGAHVTLLERGRGRGQWRIRSQVFRAGDAVREAEPPLRPRHLPGPLMRITIEG